MKEIKVLLEEIREKILEEPDKSERKILSDIAMENDVAFVSLKSAWDRKKRMERALAPCEFPNSPKNKKPTIKQIEKEFLISLLRGLRAGMPCAFKISLDLLRLKHSDYQEQTNQGSSIAIFTNLWEKINGNQRRTADDSTPEKSMPSLPRN